MTVRSASRIALPATAWVLAGFFATAAAQTPAAPPAVNAGADAKFSTDAGACKSWARTAAARTEPSTLALTDQHGRTTEGLIGSVQRGRYPGLYAFYQQREYYRDCMYRRGWRNPDDASAGRR